MKIGALTFAIGKQYQRMAALQARTFETHGLGFATVVEKSASICDELRSSPSSIIELDKKVLLPFDFEAYALELSPFDRTIKTDADLILPPSWIGLPNWCKDLPVINGQPCTLQGSPILASPYRSKWTKLGLPEVHSAFFMFDKSKPSIEFFRQLSSLFSTYYSKSISEVETRPSTDLLYSVAWSNLFGSTLGPSLPFLHMKFGVSGLSNSGPKWYTKTIYHQDTEASYLNGYPILYPFHYYDKTFVEDLENVHMAR